jgi:hypothetical protein
MGLEHVAVSEVEPGEHDRLVAGADEVQRVDEGGVDLEQRWRCAPERLVGRVLGCAERRPDDTDRLYDVSRAVVH